MNYNAEVKIIVLSYTVCHKHPGICIQLAKNIGQEYCEEAYSAMAFSFLLRYG
jgi:hypothetical protein